MRQYAAVPVQNTTELLDLSEILKNFIPVNCNKIYFLSNHRDILAAIDLKPGDLTDKYKDSLYIQYVMKTGNIKRVQFKEGYRFLDEIELDTAIPVEKTQQIAVHKELLT